MFKPQLPPTATPHAAVHHQTGATVEPVARPRALPAVSTGTVAAVLLGGVVLTALLTAVAVSAISVAVAAVVLRSLLTSSQRQR